MQSQYSTSVNRLSAIAVLVLAVFGVVSCRPYSPTVYRGFPKQYEVAYLQKHGQCYDSIPYAVMSLDLYSAGLDLDENQHIKGTGYNLYISDIFVESKLQLPTGTFYSDTSAQPFTFLPGRDYEGYPYGMYILHIEEDKVTGIQVLDSGSFVYRNDSLLFTLYYHNDYGSRVTYNPTFSGPLSTWKKL